MATHTIPLTNTFFLLTSGATVTWAHHAIVARAKKQTLLALFFTLILAILFTSLQGLEYVDASFNISDGVYGSCFYMATGFHGFHVFVGTIALFISFVRTVFNHFTNHHHFGFESAIWYWHFVDAAGAKHVTFRYFIYFAQRASMIFRFHACELPTSSFRLYNPSILSAQKAVISNQSMVHVYQKRDKITYEIRESSPCCDRLFALLRISNGQYWTEGLGEDRIRFIAGNQSEILHMRTSRGHRFAAGEARKYFSTLSGEKDNESAVLIETKNKFDNIIDEKWITNDNKLFEKAISIESLKRAWYIQKSKPGMMTKGSGEETLNSISDQWFITTNKKLLEGSFKYPNRRRVLMDKPDGG
ncbi:cytochrome c oxidase subunit 3, partial [Winogradskyella sp.]|uniref:cytochrome c oxidase subunit 3 n=1 Tax=Winogradskyella sp. TaxID=1883156 RepID=UPI00370397E1